ncbi:hypothetical protein FOA43_002952 [Brettanomyces nanus]|uniref:ethanolamine kinase n=1 Tax=Eeniella nana TaxID=13502 RepID=A0A875S5G3_EENNA|nr:uncharacterized protein FOA43_002952 [Brettanomyces nanus]QPG75595.1 hypothetical protein FOA43_002952 [Brettanomyces nanus]
MHGEGSSPSPPLVSQLLEKYCAHAIYLPDRFIEPSNSHKQKTQMLEMLLDIFPHWRVYKDLIQLDELTGGITNMLLECKFPGGPEDAPKEVLVRTYGRGTGMIIDRDREFVSHLVLNSYNLAPPIHARFGNGLVYGFIEGRALKFDEMSNPYIYPFIASHLGKWHRLVVVDVIEDSIRKLRRKFRRRSTSSLTDKKPRPVDIWQLVKNWTDILPEIPEMVKVCQANKDIQQLQSSPSSLKNILSQELLWLENEIGHSSPRVATHSDLLSGNIIIPTELSDCLHDSHLGDLVVSNYKSKKINPISFIDYEYMMPGPRAFDISNHFQEWQGFDCDKALIPKPIKTNQLLRNWCSSYLEVDRDIQDSSKIIDDLILEISLYYGMPGFYWGIWAGIQSTISLIDFDYGKYSGQRLVEYWTWKRQYLNR